jgi:cytochrome P450
MIQFDPFSEAFRDDPLPLYRALRDEDPAHYSEKYDCWFLSRFRDIWKVEQMGPSLTLAFGQMPLQIMNLAESGDPERVADNLGYLDAPRHTALRQILSPHFKPNAARELEGFTREIARGFVSEFAERGEADVIADLAMRTSVRVACKIIGLPLEKADWLASLVNRGFERDETGQVHSDEALASSETLFGFLTETIAERRRNPRHSDDAIGTMVGATLEGEPLSDLSILTNLSIMLIGGTETLPKVFSACVNRLAQNPDQRAEVAADPSLAPHAIHEALRYDMPTQMLGRRIRKEIEIHGKTLKPGQGLLFMWASANRDEREFPDPDRFDIHRRAPRILTFGSGEHMCLGANMARMEGKVMLEEFLARVPEYEVDEARATRIRSEVFRGFTSLPIRW